MKTYKRVCLTTFSLNFLQYVNFAIRHTPGPGRDELSTFYCIQINVQLLVHQFVSIIQHMCICKTINYHIFLIR